MNRGVRAPKIKKRPETSGPRADEASALHKLDSLGCCPYVCIRGNVQKKIVIWAVTVTPP
jgi:hypothetical protein